MADGRALDGRVALVTGASRGIGRAVADRLRAAGARIAVNARGDERATDIARALGDDVLGVPADVTVSSDVRAMVDRVLDRFGRLDILVNNAAVAYPTRIEAIPEDEWRRTLDVNLTGAFLCLQAALAPMRERRFGRIVNIASLAGRSVSTLGGAHYTASKAGMLGLTRAAARELGPLGITVNAVCPGLIDTEMLHESASDERLATLAANLPARRLGTPREIADLVVFLAGDDAGYITGASIDANGGSLML